MSLSGKHLTITLIAILVLCISVTLPAQESQKDQKQKKGNELKAVTTRLVKDGFDQQKIDALFSKKEIFFTTKGVSIFFSYFESAPNYHQFLEKKSIDK